MYNIQICLKNLCEISTNNDLQICKINKLKVIYGLTI